MANMLEIRDAQLMYKNFSGRQVGKNRAGTRNVCVVLEDEDVAKQMIEDGWNVKIKEFEGGETVYYLPVAVSWNEAYPHLNPEIWLNSNGRARQLDEDEVSVLDRIIIQSVDLVEIRPRKWLDEDTGTFKIKAFLASIGITQKVNKYKEMYDIDDVDGIEIVEEDYEVE
ncbi:MAG: hypothetical protein K9L62_02035 [Vallitaleaceae bacterium]|nr:hypothetical protein [Vallitaleaceae bacterium]